LNLDYGLTPQGGARWGQGRSLTGTIISENRLTTDTKPRRCSKCTSPLPNAPLRGLRQWSTVRPWKATYRNSIPEGVRVRYRDTPDDVRFGSKWRAHYCALWPDSWSERLHANMRIFIQTDPPAPKL